MGLNKFLTSLNSCWKAILHAVGLSLKHANGFSCVAPRWMATGSYDPCYIPNEMEELLA